MHTSTQVSAAEKLITGCQEIALQQRAQREHRRGRRALPSKVTLRELDDTNELLARPFEELSQEELALIGTTVKLGVDDNRVRRAFKQEADRLEAEQERLKEGLSEARRALIGEVVAVQSLDLYRPFEVRRGNESGMGRPKPCWEATGEVSSIRIDTSSLSYPPEFSIVFHRAGFIRSQQYTAHLISPQTLEPLVSIEFADQN